MLDKNCIELHQREKIIPINYVTTCARSIVDSVEVIISLFTDCNLRCDFCGDRYRQLEYFSRNALQKRLTNINEVINQIRPKYINFKIFGGELFQDKFEDDVFEQYDWFLTQLDLLCKRYNIQYHVSVSTNAVYHKVERVIDFINKWNIELRCSFDFVGRFTKNRQQQMFFTNVDKFKSAEIDTAVAMILTSQLINVIVDVNNNYHKEWDRIYSNYNIAIDYYDPETLLPEEGIVRRTSTINDKFAPSENQIKMWFKHCVVHYPRIALINAFVESYTNKVKIPHCMHGVSISSKIYWECCDMAKVRKQFLHNKQCTICDHFSYCVGTCNRLFYNTETCYISDVYDFIKHAI